MLVVWSCDSLRNRNMELIGDSVAVCPGAWQQLCCQAFRTHTTITSYRLMKTVLSAPVCVKANDDTTLDVAVGCCDNCILGMLGLCGIVLTVGDHEVRELFLYLFWGERTV